jgi:non-canonical (house-cleaning) NTP pyrophosphatase
MESDTVSPTSRRAVIKTIALGSDRAAKIMAVRGAMARVATIDAAWGEAKVVARKVSISAPAMPLTDWELMKGARERALAVRELLAQQKLTADLYLGLEGGFHSISIDGEWHTFLRGWAYVTDGRTAQEGTEDGSGERIHGSFGATPSISVPESIRKSVIEGRRELGIVIDEFSGSRDVRSRQGAWGILSRDLVTRSLSFELALIAAFAPFYNPEIYD